MSHSFKAAAAAATLSLWSVVSPLSASAADLEAQVFNPGEKSLFAVTSTLVTGPTEAVLIDAQFQRDDAQSVLKMIQGSGKDLTTVYVSHGDPDFYFGLDVIKEAYPDAKIVASPTTVEKIKKTIDGKVAFWGPILKENAPKEVIVPDVISSDTLEVDGKKLEIVGLDGHDPAHTFVWIPSIRTVAGGVVVYEGVHVWIADNQTPESRRDWFRTLDTLIALEPSRIIPGHFVGESREDASAVDFTREYVTAFEAAAEKAADSAALVEAMKAAYPQFTNVSDLELSAKVIKGEMKWPQ